MNDKEYQKFEDLFPHDSTYTTETTTTTYSPIVYEYRFIRGLDAIVGNTLNEAVKEGWQVHTAQAFGQTGSYWSILLERPREEENDVDSTPSN